MEIGQARDGMAAIAGALGGFTFQVQHLTLEDFCWCPVVEALTGSVVVGLNQVCEPFILQRRQVSLARQSIPQAADGVLDASLMPGRVGIAEEGLNTQIVELVVEGELSPVVEGDSLPSLWRELYEHPGHGAGDGSGSLARGSDGYEDTRVSFVHGQDRMIVGLEQHEVCLPVSWSPAVYGDLRTLSNGRRLVMKEAGLPPLRPLQPRFDLARGRWCLHE